MSKRYISNEENKNLEEDKSSTKMDCIKSCPDLSLNCKQPIVYRLENDEMNESQFSDTPHSTPLPGTHSYPLVLPIYETTTDNSSETENQLQPDFRTNLETKLIGNNQSDSNNLNFNLPEGLLSLSLNFDEKTVMEHKKWLNCMIDEVFEKSNGQ